MEMNYRKSNNDTLFSNFIDVSLLNAESPQNYIPLYSRFFDLTLTNFNSINLNNSQTLTEIIEKKSENKFLAKIKSNIDNSISTKPIFFKLSPLLDPIKFLIGKYSNQNSLLTLPKIYSTNSHIKFVDTNNASYVDGFFTYLTSMLLHKHNFVHGIDFYGSYLAIKNDYKINIFDDIEYLQDSKYFKSNNEKEVDNITFSLDNEYISDIISSGSNSDRKKLNLIDYKSTDCSLTLSDISDLSALDGIFKSKDDSSGDVSLMYENITSNSDSKKSNTTCSSRSSDTDSESSRESDTDEEENDKSDGEESGSDTSCDTESCTTSECSEDEELFVNISKFPIQIIALEQCERTLDSLLSNESLNDDELDSLVMQIIMTLLTYQKVFDLTHNDLHTNNIMYVTTEEKYIYYKINNKHYRVPTFGRIYKIIDFGRAIYKYRGEIICSDSFHPDGDAATQYNCQPYFNEKKPLLLPNKSFDLCRLGCSIFDFIVDELEENGEIEKIEDLQNINSTIKKIILNWCTDDKNRNIIYKKNGDERYPEFKLYKMISRTVHNHTPEKVLGNSHFNKYVIPFVSKKVNVHNIDEYPILTN